MSATTALPSIAQLIDADYSSFALTSKVARAVASLDAAIAAFEAAKPGQDCAEFDLDVCGYAAEPEGCQILANLLPNGTAALRGYTADGKALDGGDFLQAMRDVALQMRDDPDTTAGSDVTVVLRVDLARLRAA